VGSVRPLDIRLVNLACCGVEASAGIESWRGSAVGLVPPGGEPLSVLVIAGTITMAGVPVVAAAVDELPDGAVVVSFGACSVSGGPYWDSPVVVPGLDAVPAVSGVERVDVPGCPPTAGALVEVLAGLARGGERDFDQRGLTVVR